MRLRALALVALLASVAGVQGLHADGEEEQPVGPALVLADAWLPMESNPQDAAHAGTRVLAHGDTALVVNHGTCSEDYGRMLVIFEACSQTADSFVRLYLRGADGWRLIDTVTPACGVDEPMAVGDGVAAFAQSCVTSGVLGLTGELTNQYGSVRVVRFSENGVTRDEELTSPDVLRAETFGIDVALDETLDGTLLVVGARGEQDVLGNDVPDRIVTYRWTLDGWAHGTASEVDASWSLADSSLRVDDGWMLLRGPGGWGVRHYELGAWRATGQTLPARAHAALGDDRVASLNQTHLFLYGRTGGTYALEYETELPVWPPDLGEELQRPWPQSVDVSDDHVLVGLPGYEEDLLVEGNGVALSQWRDVWAGAGAAFAWGRDDVGWHLAHEYRHRAKDGLGAAVALADDEALLGAPDGDGGRHEADEVHGYHGRTLVVDLPDPPAADYRADRSSTLTLVPVFFVGTGSDPDDAGGSGSGSDALSYSWDVDGDGEDDGHGATFVHVYRRPGTYPVRVTATDPTGLVDESVVELDVDNRPPVPDFTSLGWDVRRMAEYPLYDASTDPDGEVVDWQWSTSDGQTGEGQKPDLRFTELGPVEVTLTVTDDWGDAATLTRTVEVVNHPPVIDIRHSPVGRSGEPVTFTADIEDPDGVIVHWRWNHPDAPGPTEPGRETWTMTWDAPGRKIVEAEAVDDEGKRTFARVAVDVGNRLPTADFTLPDNVPTGTPVVPEDASSDPDGEVVEWTWTVGGRTVSDPHPRLSWDAKGTYEVSLRVVDDAGGVSEEVTRTVVVDNDAPVARSTAFWDAELGGYWVEDASFDPDGDADDLEVHWRVEGRDKAADGPGGTLRVLAPTTVRVDLRVVDAGGAESTETRYLSPPIEGTVPDGADPDAGGDDADGDADGDADADGDPDADGPVDGSDGADGTDPTDPTDPSDATDARREGLIERGADGDAADGDDPSPPDRPGLAGSLLRDPPGGLVVLGALLATVACSLAVWLLGRSAIGQKDDVA